MIKLDMNQVWDSTVSLLSKNLELIAVVAGVFFFLPQFVMQILSADSMQGIEAASASGDPQLVVNAMQEYYASNWWVFLSIGLLSAVGSIGLMALLSDKSRPTLGDALKIGIRFLPTYIATQLLLSIGFALAAGVLFGLAGASGQAPIMVLVGTVLLVVAIYLIVRLILTGPAIAVDRVSNPFEVIKRSWRLTQGNAGRLFGFFILIVAAVIVVSIVISIPTGLIFGMFGPSVAKFGSALVSALLGAASSALAAGVLVAIHRQLSGADGDINTQAFE